MSAPYPWIEDSGTISGAPTGRLAITSTSGLYFSSGANASILGPTNTDLSIESAGFGDIILKTNNNNRLTINDSGDITSGKNLIINNSSTGGESNPLITLNLTSLLGLTIVQEVYNQKTAAAGTSIYDFFCNAKNSIATKVQYANINVLTPSIISTSSRGAMTFGIRDSLAPNSIYLQLDGLNSRVFIPRKLAMQNSILMNSNIIYNCPEITTPLGNKYTPQLVQYLNTNGTFTATGENNMRQVLICTNSSSSVWVNSGVNIFNGSFSEDTTASALFNGAWWVGTAQGNLYYTYDSGNTWSIWSNVGGPILVLYPFNGGNNLAVGGSFNSPYRNAFYLDTILNANDFTNGDGGFDAEVYTFCENTSSSFLYIGGRFQYTINYNYFSPYWWNWDYGMNIGYIWNNGASSGFNGNVRTIALDSNSGLIIAGGDFTDFKGTGISHLVSFQLSGPNLGLYYSFSFNPDGVVNSVVIASTGVFVGGNFSNSSGVSSCNTNYGFYANWNGSSSWDLFDYPFFSPSSYIRKIYNFVPTTGPYYTIIDNLTTDDLYENTGLSPTITLPPIPSGSRWLDIFFNGSITTFATDAQSSVGFPFYVLSPGGGVIVDLSSTGAVVVYNGTEYSNSIILTGLGATCETFYDISVNKWYVMSTFGQVQIT
jgi:hypothetical protein